VNPRTHNSLSGLFITDLILHPHISSVFSICMERFFVVDGRKMFGGVKWQLKGPGLGLGQI
jgi:hypothetical protein